MGRNPRRSASSVSTSIFSGDSRHSNVPSSRVQQPDIEPGIFQSCRRIVRTTNLLEGNYRRTTEQCDECHADACIIYWDRRISSLSLCSSCLEEARATVPDNQHSQRQDVRRVSARRTFPAIRTLFIKTKAGGAIKTG